MSYPPARPSPLLERSTVRLWSIWNLLSSFLYFCGFIIGWVLLALVLWMFLPPFFAILLGACVMAGLVLGVVGNVQNARQRRVDEELQDMASGGHRPKRL